VRSFPVRRAGLAIAAVALFAAPLRADTVTAEFAGVNPNQTVSVALGSTNYIGLLAGYYNWNYLDGNPSFSPNFRTFCVELNVGVQSPVTFNITSLTPKFSDLQASRLQEFWGEHFADVGNGAQTAAAFQLGVWEIANETGDLDLSSGNFRALTSGKRPTDSATVALAQSWLNTVDGQGTFETNLTLLDSDSSQDQITTTVPVPPGAVLGGMGLVSLIGYGLRRRRMAAVVAEAAEPEAK